MKLSNIFETSGLKMIFTSPIVVLFVIIFIILDKSSGAPLSLDNRKSIVFRYYVSKHTVAQIAESIPSPRVPNHTISEKTVSG
jgi:hypothetical protein